MTPYAEVLVEAAHAALKGGDLAAAAATLKLAVGASGNDAYVLYSLGHVQHGQKCFEDAAVALRQSVLMEPLRAEAFNDLAATLFELGRDAEALTYIRQALNLRPDLPESEESDSIWLLRYGRFREGWRKYEARFRTIVSASYQRDFSQPQWHGEPLNGRTILLHAEQGYGDTIQFVRYAPLVTARGGKVILEVHDRMRALVEGMRGVDRVLERGEALPPFDLHCPLLSLPLAFGTDLDSIPASIPYLVPSDQRIYQWRTRLGARGAKRIGIAWSGNPEHRDDHKRSISLECFARLLTPRPDREFHVLQAAVRDSDQPMLANLRHVHDHSPLLRDFADTAALVSLMDVVISVDTSIAHLAGAMGWPVWLLLPVVADWRWLLERDDSPWYPSMWLFRQKIRSDWDGVLTEVAQQLDDMLS